MNYPVKIRENQSTVPVAGIEHRTPSYECTGRPGKSNLRSLHSFSFDRSIFAGVLNQQTDKKINLISGMEIINE